MQSFCAPIVTPAKAGVHPWMPAFAGMTLLMILFTSCSAENTYLEAPMTLTHASSYPFSDKIAVIVEPRAHKLLVPIVKNVASVLGPTWKIQIFHGVSNGEFLEQSELAPMIGAGQIYLSEINRSNLSIAMYNNLMLNPYFWENVKGEEVLIFQTDSVLCSTSPTKIEQFSAYDYVGAPLKNEGFGCYIYEEQSNPKYKHVASSENTSLGYLQSKQAKNIKSFQTRVGNGGLSYRKRSKTLEILKRYVPVDTQHVFRSEDGFYACVAADPKSGFKAPDFETAKHFSVDNLLQTGPFGVHKAWANLSQSELETLGESCPELNIILKPYYKF